MRLLVSADAGSAQTYPTQRVTVAPPFSRLTHSQGRSHSGAEAMIEWRCFDLEAQLYGGALAPKRGRILVPQSPGLGIEPDPNVIRAYLRV
jgi:L-alanine-DL-glutamate epimerase-like enolase superfamily enzyme